MRTIRLHDTYSGELKELRPRDGRKVGIYACGPTVYGRIHVGNARPFVVFSLLARFLAHEGYEPTLVANITDINDKIYDAARPAGRRSDELAAEMTAHYIADTDRLGLGRPDDEPQATLMVEEIVALIGALIEREHAYAVEGDVYFRVRSLPQYGELSHRDVDQMDQGEGMEGTGAQGGPAGLRALEGAEADGGHGLGRALGPRQAGVAHRVLRDGRGDPRRSDRDPRRRQRPDLPPPRERGGADAGGARGAARADLDAQRDAPARHREDGQVGRQHPRARRGARRRGPRHAGVVLLRGPLPPAARVLRRAARGRGTAGRADPRRRAAARAGRVPRGPGADTATRSSTPSRTTTTRRARWRRWRTGSATPTARTGRSGRGTCARCSRCSGWRTCSDGDEGAPPEVVALAKSRASRRARTATSPRPTACATSCGRAAGRSATAPAAQS